MQEQGCSQTESRDQTEDALLKAKAERRLSITALICTLNEEENLPHVLPGIPDWVDEVLLVDGHSSDGTVRVARQLSPQVRVVFQPGRGKGDALKYGIEQASGDIIVALDADGETDPEDMSRFVEPLLQGYDFVKGSRFRSGSLGGLSLHRTAGNLFLASVFNALFLTRYTDICSGYNAFWKEGIRNAGLPTEGDFAAEPVMHARARKGGLKVKEVGHKDAGRIAGKAKVPLWAKHGLWVLKTIVQERFHR
jgi:glycosyltransferase involved in cell wall biosynthesis